jgi:sulfur-oxidizing protein SoxZ
MPKARIKLPDNAKAGDVIEIKTLIAHVMETGQRKDAQGKVVPRNIINSFAVTFDGAPLFKATLQPGISANPYIAFYMRAEKAGELEFTWTDDAGSKTVEKLPLKVA